MRGFSIKSNDNPSPNWSSGYRKDYSRNTCCQSSLRDRGLKVGGIVSRDLRINNKRIGFEFVDLITNETNVLASITGNGPKVGKYFVNLAGCRFAAERLSSAVKNCDVIICDEIGPMELKSIEFIESVKNLLDVDKKVIVVVHQRLQHPLTEAVQE